MAVRATERIVSGGDGEALLVHHLSLHGTNRAIGHHLGEIARARYRLEPRPSPDPVRTRVQREWLRRNAPVLFERLRGASDAFGVDVADDVYDLCRLCGRAEALGAAGCSAAFVPPRQADGHPLVSRAFDFAVPAAPGEAAQALLRPYVVELHPDAGHPSLAVVAFDLLGAVLDGVNGEGLAVVVAADLEAAARAVEPEQGMVGLDELQVGRVLLDTCATAIEARELLLGTKHHYAAVPAHWLVADRHGDAFAFEVGAGRNRVHLVEAAGLPLVMTDHPLHRYSAGEGLPREPGPGRTYARYRALASALAEGAEPWTKASLASAAARAFAGPEGGRAERTLWHAVYDLRERALEATFYLRDEVDPGRPGASRAVRSATMRFELGA